MYEPKIRCADAYRDYVNELFKVTTLDRNQIMRLMMFTAPFSGQFETIIRAKYLKTGIVAPPLPQWSAWADLLWLTQGGEGHERQGEAVRMVAGHSRIAL